MTRLLGAVMGAVVLFGCADSPGSATSPPSPTVQVAAPEPKPPPQDLLTPAHRKLFDLLKKAQHEAFSDLPPRPVKTPDETTASYEMRVEQWTNEFRARHVRFCWDSTPFSYCRDRTLRLALENERGANGKMECLVVDVLPGGTARNGFGETVRLSTVVCATRSDGVPDYMYPAVGPEFARLKKGDLIRITTATMAHADRDDPSILWFGDRLPRLPEFVPFVKGTVDPEPAPKCAPTCRYCYITGDEAICRDAVLVP